MKIVTPVFISRQEKLGTFLQRMSLEGCTVFRDLKIAFFFFLDTNAFFEENVNSKLLMTAPKENGEFCFPEAKPFCRTSQLNYYCVAAKCTLDADWHTDLHDLITCESIVSLGSW